MAETTSDYLTIIDNQKYDSYVEMYIHYYYKIRLGENIYRFKSISYMNSKCSSESIDFISSLDCFNNPMINFNSQYLHPTFKEHDFFN